MAGDSVSLPDRRQFVRAGAGALGLTWLSTHAPAAMLAAGDARRIAAGLEPPRLEFLTPDEFAEVEELCAIILPTDDLPGAREAGSAWFVDRALGRFMSPVANGFRLGLVELGQRLGEAHPEVGSLAELDPAQAIAFVRSIENTPFFGLIWSLTVWGTFALPEHGGNREGIGWSIVGFEDRHAWHPPFGHYDRDEHGGGS